jgi:hypothetical protein
MMMKDSPVYFLGKFKVVYKTNRRKGMYPQCAFLRGLQAFFQKDIIVQYRKTKVIYCRNIKCQFLFFICNIEPVHDLHDHVGELRLLFTVFLSCVKEIIQG